MLQCYFVEWAGKLRKSLFTGQERKRRAGAKDPSGAERNSSEHVSGLESEGSRGRAGKRWRLFGGETARS